MPTPPLAPMETVRQCGATIVDPLYGASSPWVVPRRTSYQASSRIHRDDRPRWEPPIPNLEGSGEWDRAATRTESLIVRLLSSLSLSLSLSISPSSSPSPYPTVHHLLTRHHSAAAAAATAAAAASFYQPTFHRSTRLRYLLHRYLSTVNLLPGHLSTCVSASIRTDCYDLLSPIYR